MAREKNNSNNSNNNNYNPFQPLPSTTTTTLEARQQLAALLRALEANRSRNGEAAANDRREGSEDPPAAATDMASLALTLCQTFGFGSAGTSWFWAPEPVPQPAVSVSNYPFALAEFEEAELTQEQAGSPDCNSTDSNDVHEDLQLESTDDGTQFFDALFEERAAAGSDLEVEEQAAVEQPEEPPAQRAGGKKAAVAESSHFASHLILWPGMDSWRLLASAEAEEPTKEAERQEQDLQPAVREKQETVDKLVAPSTTQAVWSMRKLPAMLPPPPSRAKNSQVPQSRPKSSTAPPAVAGVRAAWHQHWQTCWTWRTTSNHVPKHEHRPTRNQLISTPCFQPIWSKHMLKNTIIMVKTHNQTHHNPKQ
ncbi:unnamed protein product [Polarella glacialis]|uniref:Uncharacterized protein n=1 Tax=Polarella glacialis TaxID=89957 RepID=A0A813JMZ8_POLGL|nr:unnamed protein product [Polarella glacialis]